MYSTFAQTVSARVQPVKILFQMYETKYNTRLILKFEQILTLKHIFFYQNAINLSDNILKMRKFCKLLLEY